MRTAAKANNPAANDPITRIAAAAAAAITRTSISAVQPRRTVISMPSSLAGQPAVPNPQNYSTEIRKLLSRRCSPTVPPGLAEPLQVIGSYQPFSG